MKITLINQILKAIKVTKLSRVMQWTLSVEISLFQSHPTIIMEISKKALITKKVFNYFLAVTIYTEHSKIKILT